MNAELTYEDSEIWRNRFDGSFELVTRAHNADRVDASIMRRAQYHQKNQNVMQGRYLTEPVRVRS